MGTRDLYSQKERDDLNRGLHDNQLGSNLKGGENIKSQPLGWKKILYAFLLLIFLAIGANIWNQDISILLTIVIFIFSVAMINFLWGELRKKEENKTGNQNSEHGKESTRRDKSS